MKPFPGGQRKLPVGEPGAGLKIVRALWGPTFGGDDVTAKVAAMVKETGLAVDAFPDVFGSTNPSTCQRLEVEYTCLGQGFIAAALYGERLVIDSKGHYRTERSSRKIVDPFGDPARQAQVTVSKYKEQDGGRLLIIRKLDDLTQINFATERKNIMVVTGTASVISETEYAVTGFSQNSDMEERVELKTLEDGSIQMKRASLPVPETVTFLRAP
jgi:hypothetical protein